MNIKSKRGKHITNLQPYLLRMMDGEDATRVVESAEEVMNHLPEPLNPVGNKQGLLLGLVQSGKTASTSAAVALAADNDYRIFIVFTSDSLWLYDQTLNKRLKKALLYVNFFGKSDWDQIDQITATVQHGKTPICFVATKNAQMLKNLQALLLELKERLNGHLPIALIIDDEADQASLDTNTSKRAGNPLVEAGAINKLITSIRGLFDSYAFLQVTATPQALFLQDSDHLYRPEFTVVVEPGKGYVGGETFFSQLDGKSSQLIRRVMQADLDSIITSNGTVAPESLKLAICMFYLGATVKRLDAEHSSPVCHNG